MQLTAPLLSHARSLVFRPGRPSQINLRRAISSSYYALFHFLIAEAMECLVPVSPPVLRVQASRALQHAEMKDFCAELIKTTLNPRLRAVFVPPISPALRSICASFLDLQEERHRADYDIAAAFSQADAVNAIAHAESALATWRTLKPTEEGTAFLTALVFHKRWNR